MHLLFANVANSTLAGGISNTATSVNLSAGGGALFPVPIPGKTYFKLTFQDAATGLVKEIVHVTAVATDTFTIVRGQENTTARAWLAGDIAANLNTAGSMAAMTQEGVSLVPTIDWYVDHDLGSDVPGNGLTSGIGAFKTGAYAISIISGYYSFSQVNVHFAHSATAYDGFGINPSLISSWSLIGESYTNTSIVSTGGSVNGGRALYVSGSIVTIGGFTFSAYYEGVVADYGAIIAFSTSLPNAFVGLNSNKSLGIASYQNSSVFLYTNQTIYFSGYFGVLAASSSGGRIDVGYMDDFTTWSPILSFGTTVMGNGGTCWSAGLNGSQNWSYGHVSFVNPTNITGTAVNRYFCDSSGGILARGSGGYTWLPGPAGSVGTPNTGAVTGSGGWYLII